ncbi:MAG: hypothetical protein V2J26_04355 [Pacificimonas sp.]|jgi:hypothetical protein|nr:hypothetical protein [Pacificimonas sp.]
MVNTAVRMEAARLRPATVDELLETVTRRTDDAFAELAAVAEGRCDAPDLYVADLVHLLAILHGEMPSVLDTALEYNADLEPFIEPAAQRLHRDRQWLAELSVLTGYSVDTAGLSDAETAVRGLRDAMLTLASSTRSGCALGVFLGFLSDWPRLRAGLDQAGTLAFSARWPAPAGDWTVPDSGDLYERAARSFADRTTARAVGFGAGQWLLVHSQLLALVDARACARPA